MIMDAIVDAHYDKAYDAAHQYAMELVEREGDYGLMQVRGMLKCLYVRQGDDWCGRGEFGDADISATIAAYEEVLAVREGALNLRADKTTMGLKLK